MLRHGCSILIGSRDVAALRQSTDGREKGRSNLSESPHEVIENSWPLRLQPARPRQVQREARHDKECRLADAL